MASADPLLFKPATAYRSGTQATIQYVLKQPAQNVRIEILDAKGQVIRSYPDTTNAGGRGGRAFPAGAPTRRPVVKLPAVADAEEVDAAASAARQIPGAWRGSTPSTGIFSTPARLPFRE